jgi:drug/metabolite transporter (DMT)-like permease
VEAPRSRIAQRPVEPARRALPDRKRTARIALLTVLALVAFAGNSLLCRLALQRGAIDPASFTALRLGGGAALLALVSRAGPAAAPGPRRLAGALWLCAYALCFSFAYTTLDASTGALLLFGAVQVSMLGAGLVRGERLSASQGVGLALAVAGFLLLVRPGLSAPDPAGAALMTLAGFAWGAYSLAGRSASDPVRSTARNFALATPPALLAVLLFAARVDVTTRGALLALASGMLTSGLGYVAWYAALRGHTATSAAVVQLSVPILAAAGGVALLGERPTLRLLAAAVLTLGGVALAVVRPRAAR